MKKITLLLLLVHFGCLAQFSKTHYIPPLSSTSNPSGVAEDQYIYVSTPSPNPVNFKVIALGGATINATVSRDTPYIQNIGTGLNTQLIASLARVSRILSNKGYIIEAEDMVYVSLRVTAGGGNQAGALVSKGLAALGKEFRVGSMLNTNTTASTYGSALYTFVSVMATENNTTVTFSDIKPGARLYNNPIPGNNPLPVVLNSGQSFVMAVSGADGEANRDALIGALVTSDKNIAVNCGSFSGTNAPQNLDLGFDQIVDAERTGTKYVFIAGDGAPMVERVLLVAHHPNTRISINGVLSSFVLNAGEYLSLDGTYYDANGNLYITSSENIFAYQNIGKVNTGNSLYANQEMFFVPPLSCQTPHSIDNIPQLDKIGSRTFPGRITLITKTGSTLTFRINGVSYDYNTISSIPGVVKTGPLNVTGNVDYVTYTIRGLSGNVAAFSDTELYLASYGTDAAATFGGFYSGFTFKPEIVFETVNASGSNCLPNAKLTVNSLSSFDTFQWYFNDVAIPGAAAQRNFYIPLQPGFYHVEATISSCGTQMFSDKIPISYCPKDTDNDGTNNNIDQDNDEDGISNCTESLGSQTLDLTLQPGPAVGSIIKNSYSNSYSRNVSISGAVANSSYHGDANAFFTGVSAGKNNSVTVEMKFDLPTSKPISLALKYPDAANAAYLPTPDSEFIISCSVNETITVLNPNNQLLIDTNYDGIFESGVTSYSSFEIRFRLNSTVPIPASGGTFSFNANLISSLKFQHINLSDSSIAKSTFSIVATCVPRDTDGDGITDDFDHDSDNDGILDVIEAQGRNCTPRLNTDNDNNGIDDAYGNGLTPADTDNDGVPDYKDLDSDNDGIYDLTESGCGARDSDLNGVIDGNTASFGLQGISNSIQTLPNSGILNYALADTDANGIANCIEKDSDGDGCNDVIEAGFSDPDNNGTLGSQTALVDVNGLVTTSGGYTLPHPNYITAAPIAITTQPRPVSVCKLQNTVLSIATTPVTTYQWQVFSSGSWVNVANNLVYSGATTANLAITAAAETMDGFRYRVALTRTGNTCGLISAETTLTILALPAVVPVLQTVQCDEDGLIDGFTKVNLNQFEGDILPIRTNETFRFYTSQNGAKNEILSDLISVPGDFYTGNTTVWARIQNANGCFSVTQVNVKISATNIPVTFLNTYHNCDDLLDANGNNTVANNDRDGISSFNFSATTANITALLPPTASFTIKYYRNSADASAQTDASGNSLAIANISNYRNIGYRDSQNVWVRIQSDLDNSCFAFGPYVKLIVDPLPEIAETEEVLLCQSSPIISETLDAGLPVGSVLSDFRYEWKKDGNVLGTNYTLPISEQGIYTVKVTSSQLCERTKEITVILSDIADIGDITVNDLADVNAISISVSGFGDYAYSLDYPNAFQLSPVFNNIDAGIHSVYVKDLNGCGIVGPVEVSVLGMPKFFTPNGDGYNDTWNFKGATATYYKNAVIRIYDRYGKLMKQIGTLGEGWDGTFNKKPAPGDDYWYIIEMENGKVFKGHFALKR